MKKILGLALLGSLLFSGMAEAVFYRVDFNGIIGDGTYDGYFTYDAGLDTSRSYKTEPETSTSGFEKELKFNYAFSGGTGSFDETNAGVGILIHNFNTLTGWSIGGDAGGLRRMYVVGPLDFAISPNYGHFTSPESGHVEFSGASWEKTEISAVPLPAAVWAFGVGLLGLLGLKRRRKAKEARFLPA